MVWIFLSVVIVLCVYHRTFRRVVVGVGLVTALGFGLLLYQSRPQPTPTVQPTADLRHSIYNELYGTTEQPTARGRDLSGELFDTPQDPAPSTQGRSFYKEMMESEAVRQR